MAKLSTEQLKEMIGEWAFQKRDEHWLYNYAHCNTKLWKRKSKTKDTLGVTERVFLWKDDNEAEALQIVIKTDAKDELVISKKFTIIDNPDCKEEDEDDEKTPDTSDTNLSSGMFMGWDLKDELKRFLKKDPNKFDYKLAHAITNLFLDLPKSYRASAIIKILTGTASTFKKRPEFGMVSGCENQGYPAKVIKDLTFGIQELMEKMKVSGNDWNDYIPIGFDLPARKTDALETILLAQAFSTLMEQSPDVVEPVPQKKEATIKPKEVKHYVEEYVNKNMRNIKIRHLAYEVELKKEFPGRTFNSSLPHGGLYWIQFVGRKKTTNGFEFRFQLSGVEWETPYEDTRTKGLERIERACHVTFETDNEGVLIPNSFKEKYENRMDKW